MGLLHLVEQFPHEVYAAALFHERDHLLAVAPEWLDTMVVRTLSEAAGASRAAMLVSNLA